MKSLLLLSLLTLVSCASPGGATSNKISDSEGRACARNLFFIIPLGIDNSVYTAAKNGELKEISTWDSEGFYTGIYNSNCTVVRGSK